MAAGIFNIQKASGGIAAVTVADGATNTSVVLPESGTVATTASATETSTGLVELATTAEAQAGTDDARAITPLKLKNSVLGLGQTWQDLTASRVSGTTYTNSTGKPILIKLISTTSNIAITVGGVLISSSLNAANSEVIAIVPNGSTYVATLTLTKWFELR